MLPEEKNIRSVIKGCCERGVHISEELATVFYKSCIKSHHVDKNDRKKTFDNFTSERIIEQCINRLCVGKDPVIMIIKMQLILENDYKNREFIVNKLNGENDRKLRPLVNAILDDTYTSDERSVQFRRIIQYIILTNYMGDPTSPICIHETSVALNTVMNQNRLSAFENQLPTSKKKILKEITNLVCGIRLSNTDQKAYKEEIFKIIDTLPKAVNLLLQNIKQELENSKQIVKIITSKIRPCYKVDNDFLAPLFVVRTRLATMGYDELNEYKTILVFYLQYKKNLEIMENDLSKCQTELSVLHKNYNLKLKEIQYYFKNKKSNYDEIIHSELINISTIWNEMIEIMNYLSTTTNLIITMKQITYEVVLNINKSENVLTANIFPKINEEQQQNIIDKYPLHPMCQWYPPSANNIIDERNLFADGHCVVMIVETKGTLMECDKSVGLIQYRGKWFGFTCIQAALRFGTKPTYYLNGFYDLMRYQEHLMIFFRLNEKMADKQNVCDELVQNNYNIKCMYKDAQVQTVELNLYDFNSIKEYHHNTWEIKQWNQHKKIPNIATRSAQTLDAYKSILLDTVREVGCNTLSEKGTDTNQLQSYCLCIPNTSLVRTTSSEDRSHYRLYSTDNIPNIATQSAQTLDAYKSVEVDTTQCKVGCNNLSEKGTNTNQLESYLSIQSKYKFDAAFYSNINSIKDV